MRSAVDVRLLGCCCCFFLLHFRPAVPTAISVNQDPPGHPLVYSDFLSQPQDLQDRPVEQLIVKRSATSAGTPARALHLCGYRLVEAVRTLCKGRVYNRHAAASTTQLNEEPDDSILMERRRRSIIDECCKKPCSAAELTKYCGSRSGRRKRDPSSYY